MTAGSPLVSVVTANFNGAPFLAEAVRSVLGQTLGDLELIVVDDRSTDDSLAVIERAAGGDARVRVLVQPQNGGPGAARNAALDAARGRWIAVFDSDDLMVPDRLQALVRRGEAEGADIVVDNLTLFSETDPEGRPFLAGEGWAEPRWLDAGHLLASGRLYARGPDLGFVKPMFRATALGDARYRTDVRIGEDYNLLLRLLLDGARLRYEPRALYRYRKHGASTSHRLKPEHVQQMIEADRGLAPAIARQPERVRRLQAARTRSLERALVYERVIERLKSHDIAPALAESLMRPDVWPLLTLPLSARLKRLASRSAPALA
jgi:succinoglycan biosynthesis protein ExoO